MKDNTKHSVLIVDDENINIDALTLMLSSEYTVYTANDGQSAIEEAEKHSPDIILLDILMPEMDGYAVIAALKSSKKTQNIPVIFITGLNSDDDEEKGLNLGAVDYITKPFSAANVQLRIKHQIETFDQLRSIEQLKMIDHLTNLPNRQSFETRLNNEWEKAIQEQIPISILFIDVDMFKDYNDNYGHAQGDIALQALATLITETLKSPGDFAARWGSDEFVTLLSNADMANALEKAEVLRSNVEKMEIPCVEGLGAKITVSIGVNTLRHGEDGTTDEFISGADLALYKAKETGRNRVFHSLAQFSDKR